MYQQKETHCCGQARLGYTSASGPRHPKEFQKAIHPMASPWFPTISALVGLVSPNDREETVSPLSFPLTGTIYLYYWGFLLPVIGGRGLSSSTVLFARL